VRELNLEYAATTAAGFEPDNHRARALGKRATDASNVIEKTLRGFWSTAGLHQRDVDAVREAYKRLHPESVTGQPLA